MAAQEVRILRAITYRISAASHQDLITLIPSAASHLLDCRGLLSSTLQHRKESGENLVLHKFQTQVNTFLSARTPEGRWAATILIKAAIEVGGYQILSKSGNWVRGLLQNLNKSDPASSKKLIIITLTRIFLLTTHHQSLVRELTTPSLKDFLTICLNLVSPKTTGTMSDVQKRLRHILMPTVLDSFAHLVPSHPSIFRPHVSQIRDIILSNLSKGASISKPRKVTDAAERLFALLHFSAPKTKTSSPAEAYSSTLDHVLAALHLTISLVFRSIIEDWLPLPANEVPKSVITNDALLDSSAHTDPLGLPAWQGLHSGINRLHGLLSLLHALLRAPSSEQVSITVGTTLDVIIRLCSTTAPQPSSQSKTKAISPDSGVRINDQVSQTERDALFTELPCIHASAMNLISTLYTRLGAPSKPLHETFVEQIVWVFQWEAFNVQLRTSCYITLSGVLNVSGIGLVKSTAQQYIPILNRCCEDLLSSSTTLNNQGVETTNGLSADALAPQKKLGTPYPAYEPTTAIVTAANNLLLTALKSVPPSHLSSRVRSKLDSTAILTQNKDAMLASVLNPALAVTGGAKTPASIVPFLARADPHNLAVEGLLRPRMPAIRAILEGSEMSEEESVHEDVGNELSGEEDDAPMDAVDAQPIIAASLLADPIDARLGSVKEASQQAPETGSSRSKTKRAASPPVLSTDMDSYNVAKRQRLTPDISSTLPLPAQSTSTIPQPVVLPDASSASTRDTKPLGSEGAHSTGSTAHHGTDTGRSATVMTAIGADDSDDDFTIPEISLEMDTEDEEDEQEEVGNADSEE